MPRQVVTRAPFREVGIVNARWLLEQGVHHETFLEKRAIMNLLACPAVTNIEHQPLELMLEIDGVKHKYTPDFRVTLRDGRKVIVEAKADFFIERSRPTLDAAAAILCAEGTPFHVMTEKQIDRDGLSARAMLLMRYGRIQIADADALKCKQLLESTIDKRAPVRDLVAQQLPETLIWGMVARHQLAIAAGLNLTTDEVVSLNTHQDCYVYFCEWLGTKNW